MHVEAWLFQGGGTDHLVDDGGKRWLLPAQGNNIDILEQTQPDKAVGHVGALHRQEHGSVKRIALRQVVGIRAHQLHVKDIQFPKPGHRKKNQQHKPGVFHNKATQLRAHTQTHTHTHTRTHARTHMHRALNSRLCGCDTAVSRKESAKGAVHGLAETVERFLQLGRCCCQPDINTSHCCSTNQRRIGICAVASEHGRVTNTNTNTQTHTNTHKHTHTHSLSSTSLSLDLSTSQPLSLQTNVQTRGCARCPRENPAAQNSPANHHQRVSGKQCAQQGHPPPLFRVQRTA